MITRFNRNEKGVVAIIFAVLISTAMIIAMFVMVFDVGSIYSERRVLQKASDFAAISTAQECATTGNGAINGISAGYQTPLCNTNSNAKDFATKYANANSPDNLSNVDELCGTDTLIPCNTLGNGLYECKSVDPLYVHYVRVKASTLELSGNAIKPLFKPLVNSSDNNVTVKSCSQAAWGKAGYAPLIFPIALPICDYSINGTKLILDFSSNNPIVVGGCSIIDLNGQTFNYSSPTQGFDLLYNFGCPGITNPRTTYVGDILNIESSLTQVEAQCSGGQTQFYNQLQSLVGTNVFVPVVTNVTCQSGSNNCQGSYQFQVASFYSFKFLGGKFKNRGNVGVGSLADGSWPSQCDSTRNCIYGTFTKAIVPGSDVSTDPNFPAVGAMAVQLLP